MFWFNMVYHAGKITGAEAVIDIYNGNAASAGVEHGEECGNAAEGGTITYACGNGNYRAVSKATYDAAKSTFHTRHGDNYICAHYLIHVGKESVEASNTNVIKTYNLITKGFGSESGFLGNRHVACAAGGNDDLSYAIRNWNISDDAYTGIFVIEKLQFTFYNVGLFF